MSNIVLSLFALLGLAFAYCLAALIAESLNLHPLATLAVVALSGAIYAHKHLP